MTGKVKLGIIGLGNMGSLHCRWVAEIEDISLAAICDIDKENQGYQGYQGGGVMSLH